MLLFIKGSLILLNDIRKMLITANIYTDVLVIGAGGAGCRAAIEAADRGVDVLLTSKKKLFESGATSYPVAEMAGYNFGDVSIKGDIEKHFNDILLAGQGMVNEKLAAILACEAPKTAEKLEEWGVNFERDNDGYYIFKSCFSNFPRTHVIRGHGRPIMQALGHQISLRSNIKFIDNITMMGLSVVDGQCIGAYGVLADSNKFVNIYAKAVILATGGCGQAFLNNLNPDDVTGDGYSMAYFAGADLINMEFMQVGIGFLWPVVNICNAYLWEGVPNLTDNDGVDIFNSVLPDNLNSSQVMHEHRKHFPFSSSDNSKYLEIAIQNTVRNGKATEHGGIRANFSKMTDAYVNSLEDDCGVHHMWYITKDYMKTKGVNLLTDDIEVACFAHAVNGGVKIDENAQSNIKGLFCAGECAGGPHGADRLGGNMMVTCQVFGCIAGARAASFSVRQKYFVDEINYSKNDVIRQQNLELLSKKIDFQDILLALRKGAQNNLLVDRNEQGLNDLYRLTVSLQEYIKKAPSIDTNNVSNVNLYNMISTIGIMSISALQRRESRGAHYRSDYPQKDINYDNPTIIRQKS